MTEDSSRNTPRQTPKVKKTKIDRNAGIQAEPFENVENCPIAELDYMSHIDYLEYEHALQYEADYFVEPLLLMEYRKRFLKAIRTHSRHVLKDLSECMPQWLEQRDSEKPVFRPASPNGYTSGSPLDWAERMKLVPVATLNRHGEGLEWLEIAVRRTIDHWRRTPKAQERLEWSPEAVTANDCFRLNPIPPTYAFVFDWDADFTIDGILKRFGEFLNAELEARNRPSYRPRFRFVFVRDNWDFMNELRSDFVNRMQEDLRRELKRETNEIERSTTPKPIKKREIELHLEWLCKYQFNGLSYKGIARELADEDIKKKIATEKYRDSMADKYFNKVRTGIQSMAKLLFGKEWANWIRAPSRGGRPKGCD